MIWHRVAIYRRTAAVTLLLLALVGCGEADVRVFDKLEGSNEILQYAAVISSFPNSELAPTADSILESLKIVAADSSFGLALKGEFASATRILDSLLAGEVVDPVLLNNYASLVTLADIRDGALDRVLQLYQWALNESDGFLVPDPSIGILVAAIAVNSAFAYVNLFLHPQSRLRHRLESSRLDGIGKVFIKAHDVLPFNIVNFWGEHRQEGTMYQLSREIQNNMQKVAVLREYNDDIPQAVPGGPSVGGAC